MILQKATRKKVKIKMSLSSPTGFGKTISALLIAYGITNDWDKIAVIDTENESASLYANHRLSTGFFIGEFQTIPLEPDYTPEKYVEAIKTCESAGIEVIIIDSVTHVWKGKGGLLEYNQSLGGRYQDWAKTDPRYLLWLSSILNSKCHVICTSRKKQAYEMVTENGKTKVEKKGMEDQIRDGFDYEMTVAFEILNDLHLSKAAKDRTGIFSDKPEFVITTVTGEAIKQWCESGLDVKAEVSEAIEKLKNCNSLDEINTLKEILPAYVITDADFKKAGNDRFIQLKNLKVA